MKLKTILPICMCGLLPLLTRAEATTGRRPTAHRLGAPPRKRSPRPMSRENGSRPAARR